MKKFNLTNDQVKELAIDAIRSAATDQEVVLRKRKVKRSLPQHRLMAMWVGHIAEEYGESWEEVHHRHKRDILIPLLEQCDENNQGVPEHMANLRACWSAGAHNESKALLELLADKVTSTGLNEDQMTAYLDQIEKHYLSHGLPLPKPEDLAA